MPIATTDLLIRLSGGSGNTDPNLSLGGVMSTTTVVTDNVTHNLFDQVDGTESSAGDTEYRGVYLLNNHGSLTAQNVRVYISSNTASADTNIQIALAGEGLNATMETIANENTAPAGEVFNDVPVSYATGLNMGNIPFGQRYGLWIKRIVNSAAAAVNDDAVTIKYDCDTAA
jgi:hypothetical protein